MDCSWGAVGLQASANSRLWVCSGVWGRIATRRHFISLPAATVALLLPFQPLWVSSRFLPKRASLLTWWRISASPPWFSFQIVSLVSSVLVLFILHLKTYLQVVNIDFYGVLNGRDCFFCKRLSLWKLPIACSYFCWQIYMNAAEIPDAGGEFLLCYYSNNLQSIVGISQPFQVIHLEALVNTDVVFISSVFICFRT